MRVQSTKQLSSDNSIGRQLVNNRLTKDSRLLLGSATLGQTLTGSPRVVAVAGRPAETKPQTSSIFARRLRCGLAQFARIVKQ